MSRIFKIALISFAVAFVAAFFTIRQCSNTSKSSTSKEVDQTILLDRIEKVAKLITVEGHFSEVYRYKDYWKYDIALLRKQALIRVQAKVSIGYDLEGMDITINESDKVVIMALPDSAQILSIEHDLDYYDLSEGSFNSFSESDYNKLNADAKEYIRIKALQSDLFSTAEGQINDMVEIIRAMIHGSGYTLEVVPAQSNSTIDLLAN